MRIGIAGIVHETNTFAMERNDTMDSVSIQRGQDVITGAHPKNFIGGFLEGAARDDIELVASVNIHFKHGGIIGKQVYEECRRETCWS